MPSFAAPSDLIAALARGDPTARRDLERLCGDAVRRLVRRLPGSADKEQLTAHALRWVEMHLRVQKPGRFDGLAADPTRAWEVFASYVAAALTRALWERQMYGRRLWGWVRRVWAALWRSRRHGGRCSYGAYEVSFLCRPREAVPGDWWDATSRRDVLWVLVADVCGKSWPAYILARGLPGLWNFCLGSEPAGPDELLEGLEKQLSACLPDGLFVEAAVGRFAPDGAAQVRTAGGPIVLHHDAAAGTVLRHALAGSLLGIGLAAERDPGAWVLGVGDELLLASDGVTAPPLGGKWLAHLAAQWAEGQTTLHDALAGALAASRQEDDITVLTVRRR